MKTKIDDECDICPMCGKRIDLSEKHYTFDIEHGTNAFAAAEQVFLCEKCGHYEASRLGLVML